MKIATWNINSVRLRRNLVARFLRIHQPDVLCLQETKTINDLFPKTTFAKLGYEHQAIHGQKGYHGVAILSRVPFRDTHSKTLCDREDCRHVAAEFKNGLELHNFYVPAGGDIPDPKLNPKFAHKLAFLREMAHAFTNNPERNKPMVLVGDLNVAPLPHDVWSHTQLLNVVSHTPLEVDLLNAAKASLDWVDVTREFVPHGEKAYSWWSYRAQDWKKSDRGRRLDHVWTSRGLKGAAKTHAILKPLRGWKQASDHVPVLVELDI
ncbi:MAG: exodeoxyribonuclease III [Alphaproteobacteria bacterium]|nr:exodeoxyribonuclease III [Alphaproteobacteria bacterium]MBV9064113.1 exodeoxyribonuclease III [Alphaproteobacteria bacterium]